MDRPPRTFDDLVETVAHGELRFGEGGPLRRLERACHLTSLRAQLAVIIAVTWLPVVVLGFYWEWSRDTTEPLHSAGVHVRLLVATPLFLVLDHVFPRVCRITLLQLSNSSLIREQDRAAYEGLWKRASRRADSAVPELLIALLSVALGVAVIHEIVPLRGLPVGSKFTPAQQWYAMTDLPLFQFLLWRSIWRWFIWVSILVGLTRFRLDLIPNHPDRRGGIAFLRRPSVGYCAGLLFGISSVIVSEWGEYLIGETLSAFKPLMLLFAVGGVLIAFGPLLAFTPQLFQTRYVALIEASTLASRFSRQFRERVRQCQGQELRLSSDLQGIAAMAEGYRGTLEQMRLVLFEKTDLLILLAATLAPLVPAMLMSVPGGEWALLASLLTGSTIP